ncbi:MAG: hypothetical protein JW864_03855 [Spirochaetes bacterium]|nr:hypothetical protein [Spirochaetota bacterium]
MQKLNYSVFYFIMICFVSFHLSCGGDTGAISLTGGTYISVESITPGEYSIIDDNTTVKAELNYELFAEDPAKEYSVTIFFKGKGGDIVSYKDSSLIVDFNGHHCTHSYDFTWWDLDNSELEKPYKICYVLSRIESSYDVELARTRYIVYYDN